MTIYIVIYLSGIAAAMLCVFWFLEQLVIGDLPDDVVTPRELAIQIIKENAIASVLIFLGSWAAVFILCVWTALWFYFSKN